MDKLSTAMDYPKVALCGLHMRADGGNIVADFRAFSVARCEAAKLMTTHDANDVDRLRSLGATLIVCRIYEDLSNRIVTSQQFVSWQIGQDTSMRRMYARGVRHFEIVNEPNLIPEGFGKSWHNGNSFSAWFVLVA